MVLFGEGRVVGCWASLVRRGVLGVVVMLVVAAGGLVVGPLPAFAAGPEAPVTASAENATDGTVELHGVVNPVTLSSVVWYFEYAPGGSCKGPGAVTTTLQGPEEVQAHPVEAKVTGLQPGALYTACLVVENEAQESTPGNEVSFTTGVLKPVVVSSSFSDVTASTATLSAQVEGQGLPVSYRVQYGTSESYGSETPVRKLLKGNTATVTLSELEPDITYHFRFVVSTLAGSEDGSDVVFSSLPGGSGELPDGRAFEMVTPVENDNAATYMPSELAPLTPNFIATELPFQASAEGNAVVYASDPTTGGNGQSGNSVGNTHIATRNPGGGWTQTTIQPYGRLEANYQAFSSDLSTGVVDSCQEPTLAPEAPVGEGEHGQENGYNVLYAHDDFLDGDGGYRSLFTVTPPNRQPGRGLLSFGTVGVRGLQGGQSEECLYALVFAGASADFSHLLFEANDALLEGEGPLEKELGADVEHEVAEQQHGVVLEEEAKKFYEEGIQLRAEGKEEGPGGTYEKFKERDRKEVEARVFAGFDRNDLYVSVGGRLSLVNVLPEGRVVPNATFGGREGPDFSRVVSGDGSRVFWTDLNTGVVYVRVDGSSTVEVSAGPAQFWSASSNGEYAFYTEASGLYRFDVQTDERVAIADLGAGATGSGDVTGPAEGTVTGVEGSKVLTEVTTSTGEFKAGQHLEEHPDEGCEECLGGEGGGVTITAVAPENHLPPGEIEISSSFSAPTTFPGESIVHFGVRASSDEVTSLNTATGAFHEGEHIFGLGIPAGATITEVKSDALVLSATTTATFANTPLTTGGTEVQGVIGAGEDGSYVYFVAASKLASNTNSNKETAQMGEDNLYVYHGGETRFLATLSEGDSRDWAASLGGRTAEVTPDGLGLTFMSSQSLTPYQTNGQAEVYAYEAESDGLFCASCSESGEPGSNGSLTPSWSNTYVPRWMSDDGSRVFFDSGSALLPQDTDGRQDVYEWERDGAGSCTRQAGCVYLLSGGTNEAAFIDASASGNDVFFVTNAQLVPEDTNEAPDLYDARVGGVPLAPTSCSGTGCQGVPSPPPPFATPASVTFNGIGNFSPSPPAIVKPKPKSKTVKCKKNFVKKKIRNKETCVKKKRRKSTKAKKSHRASNDRRGK